MSFSSSASAAVTPESALAAAASSRALGPRAAAASLADLSDDTLGQLLTFLPPRDIVALASTCRRLNAVCKAPELWSELLKRDFRSPVQQRDPTIGRILSAVRSLSGRRRDPPAAGAATYGTTPAGRAVDWSGAAGGSNNNNEGVAVTVATNPGHSPAGTGNSGALHTTSFAWLGGGPAATAIANRLSQRGGATGAEAAGTGSGSGTAFQQYLKLYSKHRADRVAQRDMTEATAEDLIFSQKRLRLRRCLDFCQFGVGMGCWPWMITLWLLLLALRTGGAAPNLPWVAVWVRCWQSEWGGRQFQSGLAVPRWQSAPLACGISSGSACSPTIACFFAA